MSKLLIAFYFDFDFRSVFCKEKKYVPQQKMIRLFSKNANVLATCRMMTNVRFLSQTTRMLDKPTESTPAKPESTPTTEAGPARAWQQKSAITQLSAFDKKLLVWSGKYKSADEIPPTVALVHIFDCISFFTCYSFRS